MDKTQEKLNNLLDLLAMRSCQPLSYTEELELNHLLDEFPEYTPDYFEPIAALADSTMFVHDPKNLSSMPESIQKKIIKNFRSQNAESKTLQIFKNIFQTPKLAWAMTCLLAIGTSMSMIEFRNYETNYRNLPVKKALLEITSEDLIEYNWFAQTDEFCDCSGNVMWSDDSQRGFITLAGLPMNDSSKNQYQIWIVDPNMHANPVDGGVFDIVTTESPTIIPINPKLPIGKAKGFAITLEQTGGVVISEQPLILTAPKERPESTYGISQTTI
tara:strand:- start:85 stop:900 length:816 start_codon:yes stop_codon:yes gene_type:complete